MSALSSAHPITLSELQRRVKEALVERFPLPVWITAEISELKVNYSGHCYLELIEKRGGEGSNGVPAAQARAVVWRSAYPRIAAYFEAETGAPLAAGMQILAQVLVNYHELYGFSLQINDIDPAFTLGDMARQRRETIARLQREGVWEMNRQLPLPLVVQRIAVVSSARAAGYQDFCKELAKSPYRIETTLFDAVMQGAAAEDSLVAALCAVADRQAEFDAVAIVRGGGSQSDLNCFNAYRLAAYVAQFPLPVVTGIGHDKDESVVDLVARTPLKTPTAAAAWLVERMGQVDGWLEAAALQLHDATLGTMREAEVRLERLLGEVRRLAAERLTREGLRLEHAAAIVPERVQTLLRQEQLRLEGASEAVAAHAPQRILQLGFAVVRAGGHALRSVGELRRSRQLTIELADGSYELANDPQQRPATQKGQPKGPKPAIENS